MRTIKIKINWRKRKIFLRYLLITLKYIFSRRRYWVALLVDTYYFFRSRRLFLSCSTPSYVDLKITRRHKEFKQIHKNLMVSCPRGWNCNGFEIFECLDMSNFLLSNIEKYSEIMSLASNLIIEKLSLLKYSFLQNLLKVTRISNRYEIYSINPSV